ncbi:protein OBERON 1 isoform X1 [Rhodamnia argentea]|uniref:Protein OBERON 1 isoform X1 n=1 Tax=Rhodamnia argentea TaxID=178133 RepID=A0A8B8Q8E7_9MYRT|nr:protein OBERON 1 isoform X1 [Rhodamnia argentea]XP_048132010.1 protein OBERON 1 isoform X1 [Rhodamnia argentea]
MKQESSEIDNANETDGNIHGPINCQEMRESTEITVLDESNGKSSEIKENGDLRPVSCDLSGEGLPYAPENFPLPGDKWGWKVGKRVAITGHYQDRYLYLPERLRASEKLTSKKSCFASKLSVERYIRTKFPDADIDAFFASFIWKIPSAKLPLAHGIAIRRPFFPAHNEEIVEHSESDSDLGILRCKAQNRMCSSLLEQSEKLASPSWPCDHCCSESRFCRDCCCILCWKTISSASGLCDYIRCEAMIDANHICGHIAHLDCALQAYMAGTVGGVIGLDAEYYCRRCDVKTGLVPHVTRLLEASKSIDSPHEREKILKLAFCLLRGSQKTSAKTVLELIESALTKLKFAAREDISTADVSSAVTDNGNPSLEGRDESIIFHHRTQSARLDEEIDQVLQSLRKSQELEYRIAEEQLHAQKRYLHNLYQQLEQESSELACQEISDDFDNLLNLVLNRNNQIRQEVHRLQKMKEVAKGFGKTSRSTLREHFGLDVDDQSP